MRCARSPNRHHPLCLGRYALRSSSVPFVPATIRWQKLENGEVAFECRLSHLDELALAGTLKSLGK
jgi:hypothetical protein